MRHYKVKTHKDEGVGRFSLYIDGDWVETFVTMEALEQRRVEWQEYDAIWQATHARHGS